MIAGELLHKKQYFSNHTHGMAALVENYATIRGASRSRARNGPAQGGRWRAPGQLSCFERRSSAMAGSKLPMNPAGKYIHRPAVRVVGGVVDKLIIEAQFGRGSQRIAVIGFQDFFQAGMRQYSIAYQDT